MRRNWNWSVNWMFVMRRNVFTGDCPMCGLLPQAAIGGGGGGVAAGGGGGGGTAGGVAGFQEVEHVRAVFPETWLWKNASVR